MASALPAPLRLLRPKQWAKGVFVFGALLFTRGYTDPEMILRATAAFFAIAFVSSATYVANDLLDVRRDRAHPIKRTRPIAAGLVTIPLALGLMGVCLVIGFAIAGWLGWGSVGVIVAYLLLQVAYNWRLKREPVADVFCLSLGFVLRAALGAAAISVAISGWLLACTGALALLIGFGKRRHEFLLQGEEREASRESLAGYSKAALDGMLLISASGAAMSYGIYSIESSTARAFPALVATSLFVYYAIYRYLYLVFARNEGGEPETLLLKDPHLLISVAGFLITALAALAGIRIPFVESLR